MGAKIKENCYFHLYRKLKRKLLVDAKQRRMRKPFAIFLMAPNVQFILNGGDDQKNFSPSRSLSLSVITSLLIFFAMDF